MKRITMTIQMKISLLVVTLLVIIAIIGYFGISGTSSMYYNSQIITEKVSLANAIILNIDRDAQQAMVALRSGIITGNTKWKEGQLKDFEENTGQILERWDKYKAIGEILPEEKPLQKAFEAKRQVWINSAKEIQRMAAAGSPDSLAQAGNLLENNGILFEDMRDQLDKLEEIYEKYLETTVAGLSETHDKTVNMQIILIITGILAGTLLSWIIGRSITKPLQRVMEMLKDLAQGEGDLTKRLQVIANDEIGKMTQLVNTFLEKLHQTITGVYQHSLEVASSSSQLSVNIDEATKATQEVASAIQEVAKGASEQADFVSNTMETVGQVNATIESISSGAQKQIQIVTESAGLINQMASSIREVAASAQTVSDSAEKTRQAADKGEKAVELTIRGMDGIKAKVFETANKIKELGEHSQQIGEIIQVIDDIAEQTNLLALNAAIEAARAGEHGKGFAVVADEVRKLAERSSKATKEIADLITNIQKLTSGAVTAMEQGTGEVEQGANLAVDAGNALKDILGTVEETYRQVQNISSAAEQISASSQEVVKAIDNVTSFTQENSAATEQLTAASGQVSMAMEGIAAITEQSSASIEEVSASTEEMNASIQEISASVGQLANMAESLKKIVIQFKI